MKNKSFFKSLINAARGLFRIFILEKNFRRHIMITVGLVAFSIYLGLSAVEWGILLGFVGLVLVTEIINSCLEQFLDYTLVFRNDRAKDIKDMAAGAVLVTAFLAAVVGLIIFLPKL